MSTAEPTAYTSESISVGVLPRKSFAFDIFTAGVLHFIDGAGVEQEFTLPAAFAGRTVTYQATEIKANTTATGRVLFLREEAPTRTFG